MQLFGKYVVHNLNVISEGIILQFTANALGVIGTLDCLEKTEINICHKHMICLSFGPNIVENSITVQGHIVKPCCLAN